MMLSDVCLSHTSWRPQLLEARHTGHRRCKACMGWSSVCHTGAGHIVWPRALLVVTENGTAVLCTPSNAASKESCVWLKSNNHLLSPPNDCWYFRFTMHALVFFDYISHSLSSYCCYLLFFRRSLQLESARHTSKYEPFRMLM